MPLSSSIESQPFLNIDHRDRRVFSLPSLFEIREDKEKRKEKREKRKEKREKRKEGFFYEWCERSNTARP
ncbi:MAG: hypothetical protein ACPH9W_08685 [Pseudomonadales bacterium]